MTMDFAVDFLEASTGLFVRFGLILVDFIGFPCFSGTFANNDEHVERTAFVNRNAFANCNEASTKIKATMDFMNNNMNTSITNSLEVAIELVVVYSMDLKHDDPSDSENFSRVDTCNSVRHVLPSTSRCPDPFRRKHPSRNGKSLLKRDIILDHIIDSFLIMQNFSIVDYCSDRINNIKAFNEYISNNQTSSDNSRSKKRRTTSFRRYCIPRKHRLVPSAKVPKDRKVGLLRCRKHRRRSMLKEKDTISYVRLEINGKCD